MPVRLGRGVIAITAAVLAGHVHSTPAPGVAPQAVRGVAPADQAKYTTLTGEGGAAIFRCTSSAVGALVSVPFSSVNDDFCDCVDGSDEPGTSACAGQKETLFYCKNDGSDPAFIYTSRVNDGICDCCDGSDEWRASAAKPVACPNRCAEEGRERQKERWRFMSDVQAGIKQRRKLIEAAMSQQRKNGQELEKLQKELPFLEEEVKQKKAALEVAQKAHEAARKTQEKEERRKGAASEINISEAKSGPATTEASSEATGSGTGTPDTGSASGSPVDPSTGPAVSEYAKWMEGAEAKDATPENKGSGDCKGEGKVVSEYTKWMDGAAEALQSSGTGGAHGGVTAEAEPAGGAKDATAEAAAEVAAEVEEDADEDEGFFLRQWRKVSSTASGAWQYVWSPRKTPTERARDSAEKAHKDAQAKVKESKTRIAELQKKVHSMTDEDKVAYSGLDGRCISKKFTEYKYEVCFFKTAKQDSVSIGHWKDWEKPGVALFDGGQYCAGGPERSLRVRFLCASKEELMEVTEPSRCAYAATLMHPGACTEALLQSLESQGPRMPTDEL